ncbi:beta-amyrin 16-alpha-hydroxylase CYP87D16-like [Actinidia eriantha]|uniref:beta-amyrin 16-alpha-hydroxylase CYP87D16-like n=1 Tax=Actinidia eriantha TaxID=165200 RepID=UPI002588A345|nr:beta-amyrin 16-alpha-hydroxylase CYP87D16-like [Actinidia eriantha]
MLSVGVLSCAFVALAAILLNRWVNKWRNPKCNGVLPPGSMGFPLIGETIQLLIPSRTLDLHPFVKKRVQRYGKVFRTSVVGRPIVMSTDRQFNHYIITQEGKSVELWYLDTFSKMLPIYAVGSIQKYIRSITLNHFGVESIREKLLPQIEQMVTKTLRVWSSRESIEVKHAASTMLFGFTLKQMFGYDSEKSANDLSEKFVDFVHGLMSLPLNIPGTTYHKCLKDQKEVLNMMRGIVKERLTFPEKYRGDFLDHAIEDMKTNKFLTEDFIVQLMFGILFGTFEPISAVVVLTFKLLSEHPSTLQELTAEHEEILRNRENANSPLSWDEYKSMTFTLHVIHEVLRLGNVAPGLLRRATKDIQFNGYTVPAGWDIVLVNSALQLNPDTFKDPVTFNPSRWKVLDSTTISNNFMPFGGGIRQCAGADYSRAFVATFLHVLVSKYRWTKLKGGNVVRKPILDFEDGIHIKVEEKGNGRD